ncbi:2-amino-4-hydroxy-6-hydroxymethyldihydropteridine diphosphokinase [Mucilaginibacter sp. HMF5004]|uniref:2-amino-4-hydroxy-6- hydroxymethyldihydropteridine diphosphokinase n=1 Tax=Mucilaginibacter rivuli TaxID=2857527 RepID=UPI001C5D1DE1|nr:2-amino-4-hydroxy-6-hydroxymethyldihydropteridine diphosphokinase [Mucilaginibacter rivuli]MBW4890723.1 2-amino-4-hydroxy-6-hydroxymethyldihydropteridine diphosphokinase [Mucilaginibacter rivuli]
MNNVYLLLGSNLGNRETYLQKAADEIAAAIAPIAKSSSIHQTAAWGKTDEPDYLNQVLMLKTDMPAQDILQTILVIELLMGRERKEKWGSRTIDIDILLYGDEIISEPGLIVPHPQLHKRKFAMEPLIEIAPKLVHPIFNRTFEELNHVVDDRA